MQSLSGDIENRGSLSLSAHAVKDSSLKKVCCLSCFFFNKHAVTHCCSQSNSFYVQPSHSIKHTLPRAALSLPKLGTMGMVVFHGLTTSSLQVISVHSLSPFFSIPVHIVPATALPTQTSTAQIDVNSHSNSGAVGEPHGWMKDIYNMARQDLRVC